MKFIDLTGQKFDRLTVTRCVGKDISGNYIWECLCACRKLTVVTSGNLRRKHTQSCGCLKREFAGRQVKKHGYSQTRTYRAWNNIVKRCTNPKHRSYKNYGQRGITICDRWDISKGGSFENFLDDMGECSRGYELDRINNNKLIDGYSPENCRWVSRKINNRNKRTNRVISYNNKEYCLIELSEEYKIHPNTLDYRLSHGYTTEEALTAPSRGKYNRRIK